MKVTKLPKKNVDEFLLSLRDFGEVIIPKEKTEQKGVYVFDKMIDPSEVAWEYLRTIIPPKKYLHKPKEVMFNFDSENGFQEVFEDAEQKRILFGLHPCDIHGIKILDVVFSNQYQDPYYMKRRQNTLIIGLSCMPDEKCFCKSMHTDYTDDGFDLGLSDIGNDFLVAVGTSRGDDLIAAHNHLFTDVEDQDSRKYLEFRKKRNQLFKLELDIDDLPYILDLEHDSPVWDELGKRCLTCGNCSMVCPTCYCFNVHDELELDAKSGRRIKQWDACLFKDYALVAGGHNFREDRAERVRNRYYHKQFRMVEQYGKPSCVGCGRCINACPAGIDVVEVLTKVREGSYVES
jgi:sulfhydrogenase subunit beta (sulfur reductase)